MNAESRERIESATISVGAAVSLIRVSLPDIEALLAERPDRDGERHAALAVLRPIFAAARELIAAHDRQVGRATAALLAVQEIR